MKKYLYDDAYLDRARESARQSGKRDGEREIANLLIEVLGLRDNSYTHVEIREGFVQFIADARRCRARAGHASRLTPEVREESRPCCAHVRFF